MLGCHCSVRQLRTEDARGTIAKTTSKKPFHICTDNFQFILIFHLAPLLSSQVRDSEPMLSNISNSEFLDEDKTKVQKPSKPFLFTLFSLLPLVDSLTFLAPNRIPIAPLLDLSFTSYGFLMEEEM